MEGWRGHDVAPISFDVHTRAQCIGPTAEISTRILIEEMPAASTGQALHRVRKSLVLRFEVIEGQMAAMAGINIDDHQAAARAGDQPDIGCTPPRPPAPDLV
jgi:hypothetical protein